MSSPTCRAAPASPTKQPASTSPSRTSTASPPKSPSRPTAIRPVPMDVDRESLRKKRAASPNRNDADDESEKSPAKSSLPTVAADAGSASIDDRPTKRLHGDNSVSGSTSTASSNHAPSTSPPAKEAGSPAQSPKAPAAKPAAFTGFGAMSATSTFAAPSSSGFSGFAALANKPSVFGASSSSSTTATTSTTTRLTSTFGSGFGAFSTSTTSGTGGFSALAANAPTTSIFASASTSSLTNDARDNEDNNDDADNDAHGDGDGADAEPAVHFQPVVQLEQQQVVTGEEDEETVVSERAKLFLPDADGKPKERGIGSVKVNVRTLANGERRARVLMRADGVHNVLVNAPLLPGMSCNVSERVLQFGALVDGKLVIHTFRFKTAVPCLAIADAIRDNVPTAAVNGEGADCQESGSGEEEEEQVHGEEAV